MKLLGDWNWYLPSWLEWLPQIGDEGGPPAAQPPKEPPAPRSGRSPLPSRAGSPSARPA